jgi:hypothetical protein
VILAVVGPQGEEEPRMGEERRVGTYPRDSLIQVSGDEQEDILQLGLSFCHHDNSQLTLIRVLAEELSR